MKKYKERVEELMEATIMNAMRDVQLSKMICLTKDGKPYSLIAEEYIRNMSRYKDLCKEDKVDSWTHDIRQFVYASGNPETDYLIAVRLSAYEDAAQIMECISKGMSWEEVKDVACNQGNNGVFLDFMCDVLLEYFPDSQTVITNLFGETQYENIKRLVYESKKHIS